MQGKAMFLVFCLLTGPALSAEDTDPLGASTDDLYFGLIEGLLDQGRGQAALAFVDQYAAQTLGGKPPRFLKLKAEALLSVGRVAQAAQVFQSLSTTAYAADALDGLGRVAAMQGNWPRAADNFGRAVARNPANSQFLNNLGFAYLHLGATGASEAAAVLRQASALAPESAQIRSNLMIALSRTHADDELAVLSMKIPAGPPRNNALTFARNWSADKP